MKNKIVIMVISVLAAVPAMASTYTVNSTDDVVDATPGDDICATSGGVCTLRAAVQESNAHAGADTISLPVGHFRLTLATAGEDAAASGDLDLTETVTIEGQGMDQSTIDGLSASRIFQLINNTDLTLKSLTLINGSEPGGGPGGAVFSPVSTGLINLDSVHVNHCIGSAGGGIYHNGSYSISGSVFDFNFTSGGGPGGAFFASTASPATVSVSSSDFFSNSGGGPGGAFYLSGDYSFTVTDSDFEGNVGSPGGAIYGSLMNGNYSFSGCSFNGNTATGGGPGGAVYSSGGSSEINVLDSSFTNNSSGVGGALYFSSSSTGKLTVSGATFTNNQSGTGPGGALYYSGSSADFSVSNSNFTTNSSGVGGAIFTSSDTATVTNSHFDLNTSGSGPGGALYISSTSEFGISQCSFTNNTALSSPGGGLYVTNGGATSCGIADSSFENNASIGSVGGGASISTSGNLEVSGSVFADNIASAAPGGGLYVTVGGTDLVVTNSTFSGNFSGAVGGGLYFSGSNALVLNSTLADNSAVSVGSAIYTSGSSFTLQNSIFSSSFIQPNCGPAASFTSGNNNIDDDGSCGLGMSGDTMEDPQLDLLADNGGLTKTRALLSGSPAIDAFTNNQCPATDQRGVSRPLDGNQDGVLSCDKGAFEFNDFCPDDPDKEAPGICGCGVVDTDTNANSITDCNSESDLFEQLGRLRSLVNKVKVLKNLAKTKERVKEVKTLLNDEIVPYFEQWQATIDLTDAGQDLATLFNAMKKATKKGIKFKNQNFAQNKKLAKKAINKLRNGLAIP